MHSISNFQASMFGEFKHITPEPVLMNDLLAISDDLNLLPSTTPYFSLNITDPNMMTGPLKPTQRIQIVEEEQRWSVAILPERIDVNFVQDIDEDQILPFDEISNNALHLMVNTVDILKITSGRMSVNLAEFLPIASSTETAEYLRNIFSILPFQSTRDNFEWSITINSKDAVSLQGVDEPTNVIMSQTLVKRIDDEEQRRIRVALDINTSPENMSPRFSNSHFEQFNIYAIEIIKKMSAQIGASWSNHA